MIIVFWIENGPSGKFSAHAEYGERELSAAVARCQQLRSAGYSHVTISSEPGEAVQQAGGMIENGLLPNGQPYDWKKRR